MHVNDYVLISCDLNNKSDLTGASTSFHCGGLTVQLAPSICIGVLDGNTDQQPT